LGTRGDIQPFIALGKRLQCARLALIVGAFGVGFILEDGHYRDFVDRGEHGLEDLCTDDFYGWLAMRVRPSSG
jgi:hypothetical protein